MLGDIKAKRAEAEYESDLRKREGQERRNKRIRESNARIEAKQKKGSTFAPYQDKVAAAKRKVKLKQKAAEKRSYYGG